MHGVVCCACATGSCPLSRCDADAVHWPKAAPTQRARARGRRKKGASSYIRMRNVHRMRAYTYILHVSVHIKHTFARIETLPREAKMPYINYSRCIHFDFAVLTAMLYCKHDSHDSVSLSVSVSVVWLVRASTSRFCTSSVR